jgi:hypothetical protein
MFDNSLFAHHRISLISFSLLALTGWHWAGRRGDRRALIESKSDSEIQSDLAKIQLFGGKK